MEENKFILPIFQTPILIGSSDNREIRDKMISLVEKFKDNAENARLVSEDWDHARRSSDKKDFLKSGLTTFGSNNNLLSDPEWNDAVAFLQHFSSSMIGSVTENTDYGMTNMWATLYPKGAFVPQHTHSNSVLSGVFYVKTSENCGNIVFQDPAWVAKIMQTRKNHWPACQTKFSVPPEDGMMILFPSWLPHGTEINNSDDDRIIVSFNIDFAVYDGES